ncbi:plasmid IncI1-type surface exclusion protein ExcA [Escherichia coli]|uniref:plasmid IncI1-type surface exclusion protein ExcA n=1 Tax=Escherichia coli TaxID=562 RepID=UPI0020C7C28B|nr:plasmid IncI1-type surface exclusion protein ExcA [Escherichia coli]MCP8728787.1 plasmid IncI1-type surface exclusion protein ExcA [Escherichia coli]
MAISENQRKKKKVQQVVQQIKESSSFAPTSDYEQLSFSKSCYFGIDIKNGTMLYVRIYPNNVMDVIGLDIHNFTRTVAEDGKLEIPHYICESADDPTGNLRHLIKDAGQKAPSRRGCTWI